MKLKSKKPTPYKIAEEICNHHELLFDIRLIRLSNSNKNIIMDISNDIALIIVIESKRKYDAFYNYNTKTYSAKEHPTIKTFRPIWNDKVKDEIKKIENLNKLIEKI